MCAVAHAVIAALGWSHAQPTDRSRSPPPPTSTPPRKSSRASRSARRWSIRRCSTPTRRAGVSQGRDAAAHRLVQVPRRLQQDFARSRRNERAGGVVAYSSGNHAQGVAHAARALRHAGGDRHAARCAEGQARAHRGARRRGRALRPRHDDREAIARDIAQERGAVLVPPYDDPLIIAGQGTAGREIVRGSGGARPHAGRGGGRPHPAAG